MAKYYLDDQGLQTLVSLLKGYTDTKVGTIDTDIFVPATTLPTEDIKTNKIYLIPAENTGESNIYTEYAFINENWEILGTLQANVDLSGYIKGAQDGGSTNVSFVFTVEDGILKVVGTVPTADADTFGVVKVTEGNGLTVAAGVISLAAATSESAGAMSAEDKAKLDGLDEMEAIGDDYINGLFE